MKNDPRRIFHHLLVNTLVADTTNFFVWFAITFWVFIETGSVLATSIIGGVFAIVNLLGATVFGAIVDHHRKRPVMIASSALSLLAFALGALGYFAVPEVTFTDPGSPYLWALIVTLMIGTVAGNLRTIALSTVVTLLFTTDRDKANGLVGMTKGISMALTSVLSGFMIGFYGMGVSLVAAVIVTLLVVVHLLTIVVPEPAIVHTEDSPKRVDLRGTIAVVLAIPGLAALIFFNTFNNFLGGVFMALFDPYGLSLVSVQAYGTLWGVVSLASIVSAGLVAKYGVGSRPVRMILVLNVVSWLACIIFPLQASVTLLALGMLVWMFVYPFIEAAEQTVIQSVVPYERQGRVFGFASSLESAASPLVVFMVGPLAEFVFIPFMTTGMGVTVLGDWFGVGADRGMALLFIVAGCVGLIVTMSAFLSQAYRRLSTTYAERIV